MDQRRHDGRHGEACGPCRWGSVGISPAALPTRRNHNPARSVSATANNWNRGVARHPNGMPFLDHQLDTIPLHEWQHTRSRYERDFAEALAFGATHGRAVPVTDP